MEYIQDLSDKDLAEELRSLGINPGPIIGMLSLSLSHLLYTLYQFMTTYTVTGLKCSHTIIHHLKSLGQFVALKPELDFSNVQIQIQTGLSLKAEHYS